MGEKAILFVEDDASLRGLVAEYLTELGYAVFASTDGAEAGALLRASPPELQWALVTDIRMPIMDGIGLIRQSYTEKRPFERIIVTSMWLREDGARLQALLQDLRETCGRDMPMVKVLEKPYGPRHLREALKGF